MKVLVADKFEQVGLDGLAALGVEVVYNPDLKEDALTKAIKESEANVLIVRSTKVTKENIDGSRLSLIIRAGAGVNTIDIEAASQRGIMVANCPGKNSQAVAELAFGLIMACDRRIPDNVAELRGGKWNKKSFSKARGLYGRTLGLVGMGQIGQDMVPKAKAFGMNVVAYSRWMTPEVAAALGIKRAASPEEVASQSDAVSVHVALTPETRGLLGKSFFEQMRDGAIFVNTSRAEVVDQAAMLAAIESKKLKVGLDVFEGEPSTGEGEYDGPLKHNKSVYCTHHIGASTDQAQDAIARETVRIIKEFKTTGTAPNVVNVKKAANATHLLVVRHQDKVGVLAHVLDVIKEEGINIQEMENVVLGGSQAAIAQLALDRELSQSGISKVKANENVFDASCVSVG